jgi:capsid portal protein
MIPEIKLSKHETLARQVVNFLMAQKEGFVNAYMEVFSEADCTQAMAKLKGCHEHYHAQVTRIKHNRAIIPAHKEV